MGNAIPVLRFETMHELLAASLEDLRKVEEMPGYRIWMADWHRPVDGECLVCQAGAMLAVRGADPGDLIEPYKLNGFPQTQAMLRAVNQLREGNVGFAADLFGHHDRIADAYELNRSIPIYHLDRSAFFAAQEQLVADLKAAGL